MLNLYHVYHVKFGVPTDGSELDTYLPLKLSTAEDGTSTRIISCVLETWEYSEAAHCYREGKKTLPLDESYIVVKTQYAQVDEVKDQMIQDNGDILVVNTATTYRRLEGLTAVTF